MYNKNNNNFVFVIPAIIIFIILFFVRGIPFEDDTYIIYRYAENWALGHGPVFNVGERVEGISTFLWTAVVAVGAYLSFDPVQLTPILNLFAGIMCLFFIYRISSFIQFSRPRLMAAILPLFCALSYGFYYYTASGMDAVFFSLVLMFCIISLYKSTMTNNYLYSLPSLIFLNLVRAEGFVYSIVLLAVMTYFVIMEHKRHKNAQHDVKISKQLFATVLIFASITVLLFVLRYNYYSEWIPATVMAKGYGTHLFKTAILNGDYQALVNFFGVIKSGIRYEAFFILLGLWVPFILIFSYKSKDNILLWLIALSIAVNIFVSVWAGGDYFPYKRHFIAVLPVTIIFVAWAVDVLFNRFWGNQFYRKAILTSVLTVFLVLWSVYFIKPAVFAKQYHEEGRSLYIREIGNMLNEMPSSTTMLSQMIGKISYYAGADVYVRDILGLTDIHNAKYGDQWGFNMGKGACGRTDFDYSFTSPFDIFFYNSGNMHKKFIAFCNDNPSLCSKYRFFKKEEWLHSEIYVIANVNHPVSNALKDKFGAVPIAVDDKLKDIIQLN